MIQLGKVLVATMVLGVLSAASWLDVSRTVANNLSHGDPIPVWLIAAIKVLGPLLAVFLVTSLDIYLHAKEGHQLKFSGALLKLSLVFTPLALGAIATRLLMLGGVLPQMLLDPFTFFMTIGSSIGEGARDVVGFFSNATWWAWFASAGLPWVASLLIYTRLSRLTWRRLSVATALAPLIVTAVATLEWLLILDWVD